MAGLAGEVDLLVVHHENDCQAPDTALKLHMCMQDLHMANGKQNCFQSAFQGPLVEAIVGCRADGGEALLNAEEMIGLEKHVAG